jgi:hypothetical protein
VNEWLVDVIRQNEKPWLFIFSNEKIKIKNNEINFNNPPEHNLPVHSGSVLCFASVSAFPTLPPDAKFCLQ